MSYTCTYTIYLPVCFDLVDLFTDFIQCSCGHLFQKMLAEHTKKQLGILHAFYKSGCSTGGRLEGQWFDSWIPGPPFKAFLGKTPNPTLSTDAFISV